LIQQAVDSENGLFYIGGDGLPVFHDRHFRITALTPTATFGDAGGASQYLANPVLLPAALLQGAVADSAFGPAPGTRMLSAPDTVVPLSAPEAALAGERAAFVWRRGRLVFQVVEAASPPPPDLSSLSRLARLVDQGRSGIPGGSEP